MNLIQAKFKLKNDTMDPPETYLGATLSQFDNMEGDLSCAIPSDAYYVALVTDV